jgi:hypothetical protein
VRELSALRTLNKAGCRVPSVLDVDFKRCCLMISFIKGQVLREELAKSAPALRDRTFLANPEFAGLPEPAARLKRIDAGRKVLHDVITDGLVEKIYKTLQDIHAAGVLPMNIKYGNILIEEGSGEPYLIDFEHASGVRFCGKFFFNLLRDYDTQQFNLHFGTGYPTYSLVNARLKEIQTDAAPVYLGCGLSLGRSKPWEAAVHYARWSCFLKQDLPCLRNKRVLCLGPSSGFHAVQLLRLGAKQVIATESDDKGVKQSRFAKEALEWADNKRYDFQCLQLSTSEVMTRDLGRFDVVFAPCACDGDDPGSLSRLFKHLRTIAPLIVCRCNLKHETQWREVVRILQENGFRVSAADGQPLEFREFLIAQMV